PAAPPPQPPQELSDKGQQEESPAKPSGPVGTDQSDLFGEPEEKPLPVSPPPGEDRCLSPLADDHSTAEPPAPEADDEDLPPGNGAEDSGEQGSDRPAHEKDRGLSGLPKDTQTGIPDEDDFFLESTLRDGFSRPLGGDSTEEPESSAGIPGGGAAIEDWGNISLDSRAEAGDWKKIDTGEEPDPLPEHLSHDEDLNAPIPGVGDEGSSPLASRAIRQTEIPQKGGGGKWLAFLLVLALLGAGGYLAWPRLMEVINPPAAIQEEILNPAKVQVRSLARRDGKMIYAVTGEVHNGSSSGVGMIRVEAQFRNQGDDIVARSASFCGNVFTEEELTSGDMGKIREDLQNELGQGLANSNVGPGQTVPFLIVLEDPPSTIKKVTVTISGFKTTA
ncbi:MAG: DUF3426 domain-containing protein, partial [Proteobacteria bacterium]|nr:DUF3426 domain-containing protein [Pseudomonadota bacterium]